MSEMALYSIQLDAYVEAFQISLVALAIFFAVGWVIKKIRDESR